jgi:hypothetical protein
MRKVFLTMIAATMFFASCSPSDIELAEPDAKSGQTETSKVVSNEANNFNNNKYWLLYKGGKYELYNRETKATEQMLIDDAERLLRMPSTPWQMPAGSPYVFSSVHGLKIDKSLMK